MDSKRFDNWTRNRALRLSRRDALRLMGASGAAAAIPAFESSTLAQNTCSLTIHAETAGGPSAPASYDGTLQFTLDSDGNLGQATFTQASGSAQSITGRATGRAIDILLTLAGNQHLALTGAGAQPIGDCSGDLAGILSGPQPGDLGAWQATAETPTTTTPSTSSQSQSSSSNGSDSTTSCPPGQTLCAGTCIDTQSDPQNCGACGAICDSGQCDNGVCSSGQTCTPDGGACNVPADCCSLLCPHESQAPGVCGCSQVGGVCAGLDDCCQQGGDTQVACLGGANSDRCIVLTGACTSDSDCLNQHCVNGACSSGCLPDGESCASSTDCCSKACSISSKICGCAQLGQSCSDDDVYCCEGSPVVCFGACCIINGFACSADADCCEYIQGSGFCTNGICTRTT
ncbi:MAG TPA: hypothetical protein VFP05_19565 [Thermomicrobiales bacterium]|nr:hypothetical protein [Thermomicrobiales bacterium]